MRPPAASGVDSRTEPYREGALAQTPRRERQAPEHLIEPEHLGES
jgi:hypothetical protein